jgi:hypothetical protein
VHFRSISINDPLGPSWDLFGVNFDPMATSGIGRLCGMTGGEDLPPEADSRAARMNRASINGGETINGGEPLNGRETINGGEPPVHRAPRVLQQRGAR